MLTNVEERQLNLMRRRYKTWKAVAEKLMISNSTLYRRRAGKTKKTSKAWESARGRIEQRRTPRAIRKERITGSIRDSGVTYYEAELEKEESLNKEFGTLMHLLTKEGKVTDERLAKDIANNIEYLRDTRTRITTTMSLYDDSDELAATVTFIGLLPRESWKIGNRFRGFGNLGAKFESEKSKGIATGRFEAATINATKPIYQILIRKITVRYEFA